MVLSPMRAIRIRSCNMKYSFGRTTSGNSLRHPDANLRLSVRI